MPSWKTFNRHALIWLWFSISIIVLDQATKWWVIKTLGFYENLIVLPFFNLTHVHNYGAAFSFLHNEAGWQKYLFVAFAILAIIWLNYLLLFQKDTPQEAVRYSLTWWLRCALAAILGGAIGNLIDRIIWGYVIDFLDFHAWGMHFPSFNVADMAISGGAILLVWTQFKEID